MGKTIRRLKRLQAPGTVCALPLMLLLLLFLAPILPTMFTSASTASAAMLPLTVPAGTPAASQATTIAPISQTTSTTQSTARAAPPTLTVEQEATGTDATTTPAPPPLPSARPLNAPEVITTTSSSAAKPTPTVPAPTPTPSSPYRLPWPGGETLTVIQGNNSTYSHTGIEAYAWDFAMPTGSTIEAARGGIVRYVRDDSNAGGDDVNLFGWAGNYVVIDHGDGTSGLYMHLMYHGALVQVGQQVHQGQAIADSGGTGYATGPHLHFMVERTEPGVWYDQSLPAKFADVASNGGVPEQNKAYTSGNATDTAWQSGDVVNRINLPAVDLPHPTASVVPGVQGTGTLAWPLAGPVISPESAQQPVALIGGTVGATVVAADTGTVVFAGTDGLSVSVVIDHGNGDLTVYARLTRALVLAGDIVQRGQPIGSLGQLIPGLPIHLAVALYDHGQAVDPISHFRTGLAPAPLPQVQVPNLAGMAPAQVARAVAGLHVTVAVDPPVASTTVPAGLVANQQPAAGALTNIQSVLHIAPSSGPPTPTPEPTATSATTPGPSPSPVSSTTPSPSTTPTSPATTSPSPAAGHATATVSAATTTQTSVLSKVATTSMTASTAATTTRATTTSQPAPATTAATTSVTTSATRHATAMTTGR